MGSRTNSNLTNGNLKIVHYESACQRHGTRVQLGSYIADIVPDDEEHPSIHHCIVQRLGSPKVLYLRQEDSFAAALKSGYCQLEELAGSRSKKTAAIYEFTAPEPE
jgi:hypothetical protein